MSEKRIAKNAMFNVVYQAVVYLFPLVIAAYLSRILQSDGVGRVTFIQNIVSYFTMVVALGIPTYGTREIAKCKDEQERNSVYSSLFTINLLSTVIISAVFFLAINVFGFFEKDSFLYSICGLQLIFNIFNVDWLFQGLEEYKYIAIRSIVVRFVSTLAIVLFVKSSKDVDIYLLINSLVIGTNYIWSFIRARKYVSFNIKSINTISHIKSIFVLLATAITVELYTKIDTTFIGIMLNDRDVGLYSYSNKIVQIIISVVAAISAVSLPQLSVLYKSNEKLKFKSLLSKMRLIVLMITIPSMMGVFLLAEDILALLFGQSFVPGTAMLRALCPLIVIMPLGALYGTQCMIAMGLERKKLYATILAAITNICLTPLLIKVVGSIGACFASVLCESLVFIIYFHTVRKEFRSNIISFDAISILAASIMMTFVVASIKSIITPLYLRVIFAVFGGIIVYVLVFLLINNRIRNLLFEYVKKAIRR